MKLCHCLALSAVILISAACPNGSAAAEGAGAVDERVAVVNGTVITRDSFEREMTSISRQMAQQDQTSPRIGRKELKDRVLKSLIDRELLFQEANNRGIRVADSAVDEKVDALKGRLGGEAAYQKALSDSKLSETELKARIRQGDAVQQLVDAQVSDRVQISDQESSQFYQMHPELFKQPEQVQASHILIKLAPEADAAQKTAAREKMAVLRKRVAGGEAFGTLAGEASECPSAAKGGDLGYFKRGQMVPAFEKVAFELPIGQVSQVVESEFGYHLIKVTDKRPEQTIAYEKVRGRIVQHLTQTKARIEMRLFLEQLRQTAKIEKFL